MATTVNSEEIWKALQNDEKFTAAMRSDAMRTVARELIDATPTILATQLDEKVTLASFVRAKGAIIKWMAAGGFVKKLVCAYPAELLPGSPEELAEVADAAMREAAEMVDKAVEMVDDLPDGGMTEEIGQLSAAMRKLNPAAKKELKSGTLTIGRLLLIDPNSLIANDS